MSIQFKNNFKTIKNLECDFFPYPLRLVSTNRIEATVINNQLRIAMSISLLGGMENL